MNRTGETVDRSAGEGPLAIVAGAGALPLTLARSVRRSGRDVLIIALDGFADARFGDFPLKRHRISQLSSIFRSAREAGCREMVMIGAVRRPTDWHRDLTVSLAWTMFVNLRTLWGGDATLLSRIAGVVEREGFHLIGAHQAAPQLVVPAGQHTRARPSARDERDIETGVRVAKGVGALDVGQCVVVARGRVLAVEAAEGTDRMLDRVAELNRAGEGSRTGVLVKWPQPIQDLRIDMPTIGPETVRRAAAAGLAGIAVAGGRVLAAEIDTVISLADEHGMFLSALDPDGAAPVP